mmetsp:Transcript_13918/g.17785  ORF Transcript_13918/g.17785 Transcript_13918/m.17785 type:complete len:160 (+) Transcript_13918:109-588(+)
MAENQFESVGITVRDVGAAKFIAAYAAHLKTTGQIELPRWVDYVKTGTNRELSPYDDDWFYIRAAAIARKVYLRPGCGVGGLKKAFGGKTRRGTMTNTFGKGSGSIIRYALQQLEEMKVLDKDENGGRRITKEGQQDLDRIARQVHLDEHEDADDDEDL